MRTNSVTGGFSYSDASTKKGTRKGQPTGHGNPSNKHASRKGSTVRKPKSSSEGKLGLSVGQRVPMSMFDQQYKKPNYHGMAQVQDANTIKRAAKKSLGGKQKKFFGL